MVVALDALLAMPTCCCSSARFHKQPCPCALKVCVALTAGTYSIIRDINTNPDVRCVSTRRTCLLRLHVHWMM